MNAMVKGFVLLHESSVSHQCVRVKYITPVGITLSEKHSDVSRVLEIARGIERRGYAFYQETAKAASDEKVERVFLTLAEDEVRHSRVLDEIERHLKEEFPAFSYQTDFGNTETRYADMMFPGALSSISSDTNMLTEAQVLERGLQLERESIEMYEDAADRQESRPAFSNAFRALVMEERIHHYILNVRLDHLKLKRRV